MRRHQVESEGSIGPVGPIGPIPGLNKLSPTATVTRAAFNTFGCPSAMACGSMICTLITGREVEKLKLLTAADLLLVLGGLPEGKEFCAELAVKAMRAALT